MSKPAPCPKCSPIFQKDLRHEGWPCPDEVGRRAFDTMRYTLADNFTAWLANTAKVPAEEVRTEWIWDNLDRQAKVIIITAVWDTAIWMMQRVRPAGSVVAADLSPIPENQSLNQT